GAFETGHPAPFELLDIGGVDLLQRRVTLIGHVAAVGHPVLPDRALKQTVDLRIGSPNLCGSRRHQTQSDRRRSDTLHATPHDIPPSFFPAGLSPIPDVSFKW